MVGKTLLHNGKDRRDSDDVAVWEPANRSNHLDLIVDGASAVISFVVCSTTPLKMVVPPGDTTLKYKFLRMSTLHTMCSEKEKNLTIDPTGWRHRSRQRRQSTAHQSAQVSACTAGLVPGCLQSKSSYHHSNTVRVKSVSHQRAGSTPRPHSYFPNRRVLGEKSHSNLTFQIPVTDAEHDFGTSVFPDINDISDAESPLNLEERHIDAPDLLLKPFKYGCMDSKIVHMVV